jgi:hypothetical protein
VQDPSHRWGEPVWSFPVPITPQPLPDGMRLDVAVVGAGFTGLATGALCAATLSDVASGRV